MGSKRRAKAERIERAKINGFRGIIIDELATDIIRLRIAEGTTTGRINGKTALSKQLANAGDSTYPRHLAQQDILDSYQCNVCYKGHETCRCEERNEGSGRDV